MTFWKSIDCVDWHIKFWWRRFWYQHLAMTGDGVLPMGLQEPENQVLFLSICATSPPTTHLAHMEKNTLQYETNHIIQTKLSCNWKIKIEVPFSTMFIFHFILANCAPFHAWRSLLLLIEKWKYWHTEKHTAINLNWS